MTTLSNVQIFVSDLERAVAVYAAVCDAPVIAAADDPQTTIDLGDARITLTRTADPALVGVRAVTLGGADIEATRDRLNAAAMPFESSATALIVSAAQANGIQVRIESALPGAVRRAGAALDHVALLVSDLAGASAGWEAITGIPAVQMGLHPISNGAFSAARLELGNRMIELIHPTPGMDSNIAKRLVTRGEGPVTLALPVANLAATRARLATLEVDLIRQDPHWMLHPRTTGGVLVQLTPRVKH